MLKNNQADSILAMEEMEKRTEDRVQTATQIQQQAERDAKYYEVEYLAEQRKVTKLEERLLQLR